MNQYYVYIMSSAHGAIYIGMTNNLERRGFEHKNKQTDGHTAKYNITNLVYFEQTSSSWAAIEREKQFKKWSRGKKLALIKSTNPEWKDLSKDWFE